MKRNAYGGAFFKRLKLDFVRLDIKKTSDVQMVLLLTRVNNYFSFISFKEYFLRPLSLKAHLAMVPRSILKPLSNFFFV
jgi:hypothetical protein